MAVLEFGACAVRRIITHAKAAPAHQMGWSSHLPQAAVILVGDQGVYLMSNGEPALKHKEGSDKNFVAYAQGMNPLCDPDWWEAKRNSFGADDGADTLLIVDELFLPLERGEETIKLEITEDHIGVLMPDVSWIKPGVMIKTTSGLGGVFHARILSVTDTHASVQNEGNAEDFDDAPPYLVPLGKLSEVKKQEVV